MDRAEELYVLAKDMERRLPREANDAIAMEASSLFIQEFIRGRSGAHGDLSGSLLWGVWPRHPYDDAVSRLRDTFARCMVEGGSLARAVEAAVETAVGSPVETGDESVAYIREAALKAVRDAAAEAIEGTARAWARDVHWDAGCFQSVATEFEAERTRRIETGDGACMPLDSCGGALCCLGFAAFLFSTHYEVASWTPADGRPFMWRKEDHERFVRAVDCEKKDKRIMRDFAGLVPNVLFDEARSGEFLHACLFRDPFEVALEEAVRIAPGIERAVQCDADARAFGHEAELVRERAFDLASHLGDVTLASLASYAEEVRSYAEANEPLASLALLTFVCCQVTGREEARGYCACRLGIPKNLA